MLRFYHKSKRQINRIRRYIYLLCEISFDIYYQITSQEYSISNKYRSNRKEQIRQRHNRHQILITILRLIIFMILFIIIYFLFLVLLGNSNSSKTDDIFQSNPEIISLNRENSSMHYIYIDIGCFNGETIEYFLHFIPNSTFYDIITFEPDPFNYKLCKRRLSKKKYKNINIIILQKVVWIRDEKIYFRAEHGSQSRIINTNAIASDIDSKQLELDAIDFSSWLARLVKPNKTKVYIKISMPGAEVLLLEKMIFDNTLGLVNRYEIEWTDKENPKTRARRIYVQLMMDSYGFDCLYYTNLENVRNVFYLNGAFNNITKYYDWRKINQSDTYAHYLQRPDVAEISYGLNHSKKKIN